MWIVFLWRPAPGRFAALTALSGLGTGRASTVVPSVVPGHRHRPASVVPSVVLSVVPPVVPGDRDRPEPVVASIVPSVVASVVPSVVAADGHRRAGAVLGG
ncbi:hypothetical protein ACFP2T_30890 [Plantactinospora solaniradicis]|uniref:Secreted protein n=1 Tax=Plantactinospora solaniradicis TaxID=1723736 RepID=A0ABW1KH29_9ACTN